MYELSAYAYSELQTLGLFLDPISPAWEDVANAKGGRLILRVKKDAAPVMFEESMLMCIGNTFQAGDVNGVLLSTKAGDVAISFWTSSADEEQRQRVTQALVSAGVPESAIEWKPHQV